MPQFTHLILSPISTRSLDPPSFLSIYFSRALPGKISSWNVPEPELSSTVASSHTVLLIFK